MPLRTGYKLATLIAGLIAGGIVCAFASSATASNTAGPKNDRFDVIGHLAFDGKGVTGLTTGEHWRKSYLYVSFDGKIKVVDITDGATPKVAQEFAKPTTANG